MKKTTQSELIILGSCLFFAFTAVLAKIISSTFSGAFVAFGRFLSGGVICLIIILFFFRSKKIYNRKFLLARGFFGGLAILFYFISIQLTNSGRATLLNNTYPVFTAILGPLFFKEKAHPNSIAALLICLAGLFLVFFDNSHTSLAGNLFGLLSSLFAGLTVFFIKKSRAKNNPVIVYLSACVMGLLVSCYSLPGAIPRITPLNTGLLVLVGISGFIAQFLMSFGIKYTTASRASIITFFKIPATLLLSVICLGEVLKARFIAGAFLIIAGLVINSIPFRKLPAPSEVAEIQENGK